MATYKIKGIPGFDGLLAVGDLLDSRWLNVEQIVNTNLLIGDRELKFTLPEHSILLSKDYLEEVEEEQSRREFASDNPYGQYLYENKFTRERLRITTVVFDEAVSVTLTEVSPPDEKGLDRTIWSGSFFKQKTEALRLVQSAITLNIDPDDLIFGLTELKEKDTDG